MIGGERRVAPASSNGGEPPLIEVRDLSVRFPTRAGEARAVDGVSFDWKQGEILGVVGESGCGKSTTARAILGLVEAQEGEVLLDGKAAEGRGEMRDLRQRIQMIFQDPYQTLNPRHRVRTLVAEPLVVMGIDRSEHETRVAKALNDVGLEPERYKERYPHQLSGGQRQRVAIAAALVLEPDGLICDEPVSMLDTSVQSQVLDVLCGLRESRGLGLLFITHDLSLAWSLCDRLCGHVPGAGGRAGHGHRRHRAPAAPIHAARSSTRSRCRFPAAAGERDLLPGELPDPTDVPSGCRFHPRCPKRFAPCDSVDPGLLPAGASGQLAACLLHDPAHAGKPQQRRA